MSPSRENLNPDIEDQGVHGSLPFVISARTHYSALFPISRNSPAPRTRPRLYILPLPRLLRPRRGHRLSNKRQYRRARAHPSLRVGKCASLTQMCWFLRQEVHENHAFFVAPPGAFSLFVRATYPVNSKLLLINLHI